jgi:enoyl-CoA hydratase
VSDPFVLVERDPPIAVVTLNRSKQLNALSSALMGAVADALAELDTDDGVHAIVLAGDERAFAAGADIAEFRQAPADGSSFGVRIEYWDRLRGIETPIVAAVSGYALGGGCELAMACDLIVASETARFGQPEVNLGLIPGAGGTQRLVRAIGKAKAMDVILTGRFLDAREAEQAGLVSRVVAKEAWLDEARRAAREIAAKGPLAVKLAKAAVNEAFETPLEDGLRREREAFGRAFASEDAREGLAAFVEKRPPTFGGR